MVAATAREFQAQEEGRPRGGKLFHLIPHFVSPKPTKERSLGQLFVPFVNFCEQTLCARLTGSFVVLGDPIASAIAELPIVRVFRAFDRANLARGWTLNKNRIRRDRFPQPRFAAALRDV